MNRQTTSAPRPLGPIIRFGWIPRGTAGIPTGTDYRHPPRVIYGLPLSMVRFGHTPVGNATPPPPPPPPFAGFVMNGINAASPFDFWLYNPKTGQSVHVGGLPNEDFKPN